jgi:hypothetical protein
LPLVVCSLEGSRKLCWARCKCEKENEKSGNGVEKRAQLS